MATSPKQIAAGVCVAVISTILVSSLTVMFWFGQRDAQITQYASDIDRNSQSIVELRQDVEHDNDDISNKLDTIVGLINDTNGEVRSIREKVDGIADKQKADNAQLEIIQEDVTGVKTFINLLSEGKIKVGG